MKTKKAVKLLIGLAALTGFVLEFIHQIGLGKHPFELLTYFTIQSNIIVIIYCFSSLRKKSFFFNSSGFAGLALVNITITGIIFFILLRKIYHPTGIGHYSNIIEHYIVPGMMLVDFFISRSRQAFRYIHIGPWIGYAFCYLVLALGKGSIFGKYPYPFLDISKHGGGQVFQTVLVIGFAFGIISLLLVTIDRWLKGRLETNI